MSTWFNFLVDIGSWTAAVIAIYEGSRRLTLGERGKVLVGLVAGGATWCLFNGGAAFYVSSTMNAMSSADQRPVSELATVWGSKLPPEEREKRSATYASVVYSSTGKLVDYFDRAGERRQFVPTQEQLRERESVVTLKQQMESLAQDAFARGFRWLLPAVLALIIGWCVGRNQSMTANRPMQPTAGSGG